MFSPLLKRAILGNRRKLAAINVDNHGEQPKKNQAWDTYFPSNQVDYITQVSEAIEGRVTKKLSEELIRMKSPIWRPANFD